MLVIVLIGFILVDWLTCFGLGNVGQRERMGLISRNGLDVFRVMIAVYNLFHAGLLLVDFFFFVLFCFWLARLSAMSV